MPVQVHYSDQYNRVRATFTRATRLAIEFVEDEIARDPSLGPHRRERPDGSIWDYSAEDIYVVYRRVSENLVEFERLIDLRAPDASVE
jgi:hypothetical protein